MKKLFNIVFAAALVFVCGVAQAGPPTEVPQPNQPGWSTVWGGQVGQPGQPLFAYQRQAGYAPGTGTAIVGGAITLTGAMMGPAGAATYVTVIGIGVSGYGAFQAGQDVNPTNPANGYPTWVYYFPASGYTGWNLSIIMIKPPPDYDPGMWAPPNAIPGPGPAAGGVGCIICDVGFGGELRPWVNPYPPGTTPPPPPPPPAPPGGVGQGGGDPDRDPGPPGGGGGDGGGGVGGGGGGNEPCHCEEEN